METLLTDQILRKRIDRILVKPLKYGDFLFPGKRTYSKKKQRKLDIKEDVMLNENYSIPLEELLSRLDTSIETGLKEIQVHSMREKYGENIIFVPDTANICMKIKQKIRGTYNLLIIGAIFCFVTAAIPSLQPLGSLALDNMYIGFVMIVLLVTFSLKSYFEEMKSLEIMSAFKLLYPQYASVIRDGLKTRIHRNDVVVGDLVLIKKGNYIPADIRITEAWDLIVEEASLIPKENVSIKTPQCTNEDPTQNVAFCGTWCINGYGQGIAIATGNRTAYGEMLKKSAVFQSMNATTHKVTERLFCKIGVSTTVVCLILLSLNLMRGYSWIPLSVLLLSLVIASMPYGLYSTITASLHLAATKMVSTDCLPTDYEAVEKVGSVSVICCNKTGTITQNRMTVVRAWIDGNLADILLSDDREAMNLHPTPTSTTWDAFARVACLCNSTACKSRRNRCIIRKGCSCDQSEEAILQCMHNISRNGGSISVESDYIEQNFRKVFEVPRDSFKKFHMTVHDIGHRTPGGHDCTFLVCIKGAVEVILEFCSTVLIEGKEVPISTLEEWRFRKIFKHVMKKGERILGFCDYVIPEGQFPHEHIFEESDIPLQGFRFLGFVSLLDPPRPNVPQAISKCKSAGIKVILMTSDHPITAKAIAKEVGIISAGAETRDEVAKRLNISEKSVPLGTTKSVIVNGSELGEMDKEDLLQLLRNFDEIVFARINSSQKLVVVDCLQHDKHVVAVTGDDMDDVLAMDKADIGIGMGMHGCDISRYTADVILLGDNFASFVYSMEAGRLIFENLQKATVYVLSSNLPELFSIVTAFVLGVPFTLGAMFVLVIMGLTETTLSLFFAHENADKRNTLMSDKLGPQTFVDGRIVQKAYCLYGVMELFGGIFVYFVVMAENGFMPSRLLGIAKVWDSPAINDLTDSYNQEWTYCARKSLQYTCQTAFFLAVILMQWVNFLSKERRCDKLCPLRFLVRLVQKLVIAFLMFTPGISTAFHFFPVKFVDICWIFPFLLFFGIYKNMGCCIKRCSCLDKEDY